MTNIYKIAYGSLLTTPGDSVLYYTGDISSRARGINGIFVDNPPVLDPSHATLIWRYYADSDRYVFMHIQGSYALFPAQGRVYPYRAAFEVTRADVNALADSARHFPIAALVAAMPRIDEEATETSAKKQPATPVDISISGETTTEASTLADNITFAIYTGQRLHIELPPQASALKNNDIFDAPQLATLLAAIEQLPVGLARYASFAFCADEHHAAVTDDVLIMLYPNEKVPAGVKAHAWETLISQGPNYDSKGERDKAFFQLVANNLPGGKDKPLLSGSMMLETFRKNIANYSRLETAGCAKLKADELEVWLGPLGHKVEELPAKHWHDVRDYCARLKGSKHLAGYIKLHRSEALAWTNLDGLDEATVKAFALNPEEYKALRKKAFETFWTGKSEGKHLDFLFANDKGKAFIADVISKEPKRLQQKVGSGFGTLVKYVTSLTYINAPTWEKAFKGKTFTQTEGYGPEAYDENLEPEKKEFLEKRRKASLAGSAPSTWAALTECLKMALGEKDNAADAALRFKKFTADNCSAAVNEGKGNNRLARIQLLASFAQQLAGSKAYKKHTELHKAHGIITWFIAEECKATMERAMFNKDGSLRQRSLATEFCKVMNDANLLVNKDIEEGDNSSKHYRNFFVQHFGIWEGQSHKKLVEYLPKLQKSIEAARKKEDTNGLRAAAKLLKEIWKFVSTLPEGRNLKPVTENGKAEGKGSKGKTPQGKAAKAGGSKSKPKQKAAKQGFLDVIKNFFKNLMPKDGEETMNNEEVADGEETKDNSKKNNPAGIERVDKAGTEAPKTDAPVSEEDNSGLDTHEDGAPEDTKKAVQGQSQGQSNRQLKLIEFKENAATYKLALAVTRKRPKIDRIVILIVVLALILAGVLAFFLLRDATPDDADVLPSDPATTPELVLPGDGTAAPGTATTAPGTATDTLFGTATSTVKESTPTPGLDASTNLGEAQP